MAYQTYTTEAIVCGTFNRNTADRSYLLFTREAGMLYAEAKSVREERSRQRMSLQDFSYVRVSLVKGKSSWKIGSIEPKQNFFMAASDKAVRGSVVLLVRFLRRFCAGGEAAADLFDYVLKALQLLSTPQVERDYLEKIIETRILFMLGYVDERALPPTVLLDTTELPTDLVSNQMIEELTHLIDTAISVSQL